MNLKTASLLFVLLFSANFISAQLFSIRGSVMDGTDNSSLIGVTVTVTSNKDTIQKLGHVTMWTAGFLLITYLRGSIF